MYLRHAQFTEESPRLVFHLVFHYPVEQNDEYITITEYNVITKKSTKFALTFSPMVLFMIEDHTGKNIINISNYMLLTFIKHSYISHCYVSSSS